MTNPAMSPHSDRDVVARATKINQPHRDLRPRCNPARDANIHLVESRISRSLSEPQHLSHAAADSDLRRNHIFGIQPRAVDLQWFIRNRWAIGRYDLVRVGM